MSDIYLSLTETPTVVTLSQPVISGALSSTVTVANTVTVALDANSLSALKQVTVTVGAAVSVSNFPASQVVSVSNFPVSSSVTVANFPSVTTVAGSVAVSNFPASSSVTIGGFSTSSLPPSTVTVANTVTIAGTVTANGGDFTAVDGSVTIPARAAAIGFYDTAGNGLFKLANSDDQLFPVRVANLATTQGISGTVTANAILQNANAMAQAFIDESNGYGAVGVSIVNAAQSLSVFGAVTAAAHNGSLTTRFGTPTTANVSFATSAVTNANRKYLLIQNVTTGSNVITVGIGFTPTTTQGIQLAAGAGITFESSYIPTGAVWVLSSVTASNFTILEA